MIDDSFTMIHSKLIKCPYSWKCLKSKFKIDFVIAKDPFVSWLLLTSTDDEGMEKFIKFS